MDSPHTSYGFHTTRRSQRGLNCEAMVFLPGGVTEDRLLEPDIQPGAGRHTKSFAMISNNVNLEEEEGGRIGSIPCPRVRQLFDCESY